MSILKLFEENQKIHEGQIYFNGEEISTFSERRLREVRGNDISVIFQEPMTSLNPVFKVKRQIGEVLRLHQGMTKKEALQKSISLLSDVGISNPEKVVDYYSFQLSGGMCQRVMIAMALACRPKLLMRTNRQPPLTLRFSANLETDERTQRNLQCLHHFRYP